MLHRIRSLLPRRLGALAATLVLALLGCLVSVGAAGSSSLGASLPITDAAAVPMAEPTVPISAVPTSLCPEGPASKVPTCAPAVPSVGPVALACGIHELPRGADHQRPPSSQYRQSGSPTQMLAVVAVAVCRT